jgi:hypothetical protein
MDRYEIHNFYTEEWMEFEKRQKGIEALEFLIDTLCHAGLVRRVEVNGEELRRLGAAQCGWCVDHEECDGALRSECAMRVLSALGLQPPKEE